MTKDPPDLLDELDIRILRALGADAKRSCREIAEKLGVAPGTVYNRIKKMTAESVIRGYALLVDPQKVGLNLTVLILIQVEGQHLTEAARKLADLPNVISVYDITGEYDVAITVRFPDRVSLDTFLKEMLKTPYIKKSVTNVVLNVVREDFRVIV